MSLVILMYHYIRDFSHPGQLPLKGLDVRDFERQLDLVAGVCNFVTMEQVIDAWSGGEGLPKRSALLTFDDGYKDHYEHAFPLMKTRGITGAFYPTAAAILEGQVLDVNKIHFILATEPDTSRLVASIRTFLEDKSTTGDLPASDELWQRLAVPGRYDPAEIMFVKACLQYALPEAVRGQLVEELFRQHVDISEQELARKLYLSSAEMREMQASGMHFGNHSATHKWLSFLDQTALDAEIDGGLEMLDAIGVRPERWTMCYPFEGPTTEARDRVIKTLHARKCAVGLTTALSLADPAQHNALLLPRYDTNDLPRDRDGLLALFNSGAGQTG